MRLVRNIVRVGEMRNAYILVGRYEGENTTLGIRRRWVCNIKMVANWIHVAEDRSLWKILVNTVMNVLGL